MTALPTEIDRFARKTTPYMASSRRRRWLSASAVILGVLILGTLPQLFSERRGVAPRMICFAVEAPLIIVALSLYYERAARRRIGTARKLVGSLALSGVVGLTCALGFLAVVRSFGLWVDVQERRLSLHSVVAFGVVSSLVLCALWALGFVYPFAAEEARLRTLEAEKLKLEAEKLKLEAEKLKLEAEKLKGAAELALLRSQLEPHFLLNTLNAIAGLVTKRPKEARRLLGCLGDLLRDSLRDPDEMQPIAEEITWLHRYAEILESRHAGGLQFHWEVEDDALGVLVPRLLLQPLVENAVNHGALQRSGGGEVTVRVAMERAVGVGADHVLCTVEDNGPGLCEGEPRSGAFGLHSVRRRLELKYEAASLRLESSSAGTRAIVRLPRVTLRDSLPVVEAV